MNWKPNEFKLAINMAGAVSAGAYTAGVLDFLTEAIEEWETRKRALRVWLANPAGPAPELVPLHDLRIEVFSGASAGGMCAAIASVMVQHEFTHIHDTAPGPPTNNTFYEAWVNQIDIRKLLGTDDLDHGQALISLLDSTIIDTIAAGALTPDPNGTRPDWISENLTLFLTLTNVRGTPYQLYEDPNPAAEEFIAYYGDQLQFETTAPGASAVSPAKALPAGQPGSGAWPLLHEAAKATGAFPLFLAPRILTRDTADYTDPPWTTPCTRPAPPVNPSFPQPTPVTIETLNVDGGITDNNPFELAHDLLASQNPRATRDLKSNQLQNPRPPGEANCAVLTVAPFPMDDRFDPGYVPESSRGLWQVLGRLVTVLLSQSRFLGESLSSLAGGTSFSRFVIAPSDSSNPRGPALQCGLLGSFGGFFDRGFRVHDFLLGRRNCQQFLKTQFVLPTSNPIIGAGLTDAGARAGAITGAFSAPAPTSATQALGLTWLPIIPCVGKAAPEVTAPPRATITRENLNQIVDLILARARAVKPHLLEGAPGIVRFFAGAAMTWPLSIIVKDKIRDALATALCPNVEGQRAGDCVPKK